MIITRTPFRVTLGGGGTDLPSYYSRHGGFVFAAGIDKYIFIDVNRPIVDDLVRLKYSKSETVSHRDELTHDLAREALRLLGIERAIEISSLADIPSGTGLGSSSCYTVGVLHALHALLRDYCPLAQLAEEDFCIEAEILKRPIGKQDPYMAAFGGLTVLEIARDGKVAVRRARASEETVFALNANLLLFYTHTSRPADGILGEQQKAIAENKETAEYMHAIKEIGYRVLEAVETGNLTDVGLLFDKHWEWKKKISAKMTTSRFDEIYRIAKDHGALGGKISGAGGGGFFAFYVEGQHEKLRAAMKQVGLREMRYRFDFEGTKVLVNI